MPAPDPDRPRLTTRRLALCTSLGHWLGITHEVEAATILVGGGPPRSLRLRLRCRGRTYRAEFPALDMALDEAGAWATAREFTEVAMRLERAMGLVPGEEDER